MLLLSSYTHIVVLPFVPRFDFSLNYQTVVPPEGATVGLSNRSLWSRHLWTTLCAETNDILMTYRVR